MPNETIPEDVRKLAKDRADWVVDAVATSTQNRQFLRGEPEEDNVATESIFLSAEKAISVAIMADRASRATGAPRPDEKYAQALDDAGFHAAALLYRAAPAAPQPEANAELVERKTFVIPEGYEAVRDSEGRATGELAKAGTEDAAIAKHGGRS